MNTTARMESSGNRGMIHLSQETAELLIAAGKSVPAGSIGKRETFADIGQSLAVHFGLEPMDYGTTFL